MPRIRFLWRCRRAAPRRAGPQAAARATRAGAIERRLVARPVAAQQGRACSDRACSDRACSECERRPRERSAGALAARGSPVSSSLVQRRCLRSAAGSCSREQVAPTGPSGHGSEQETKAQRPGCLAAGGYRPKLLAVSFSCSPSPAPSECVPESESGPRPSPNPDPNPNPNPKPTPLIPLSPSARSRFARAL